MIYVEAWKEEMDWGEDTGRKYIDGSRAGQNKPAFDLENILRQSYSEVWKNEKYLGYHVQYNEYLVFFVVDQFSHD